MAGRPILADTRNEENLILAQFHVAMLRFHNRLITALENAELTVEAWPGESLFETARRIVTWHYQYLVLEDLLIQTLNLEILRRVRRSAADLFLPRAKTSF